MLELQSSFLNDSFLDNHLENQENKTHILASSELFSEKGSGNFSGSKKLLQCNIQRMFEINALISFFLLQML